MTFLEALNYPIKLNPSIPAGALAMIALGLIFIGIGIGGFLSRLP